MGRDVRRYANANGLGGMQVRIALAEKPRVCLVRPAVEPQPPGTIRIDDWSTCYVSEDPFRAPELNGLCLQGTIAYHPRTKRGGGIRTSAIVAVDGRTVRTRSGSLYYLGRPSHNYVEWLRKEGKPLDEKQPIKLLSESSP